MAADGTEQAHRDLSLEYLLAAEGAYASGAHSPAHFLLTHALELGVKAALAKALPTVPKTHNVGGEFGKHFRHQVGAALTRRVNRILDDYDGPRYPDWEPPSREELESDLRFVSDFLRKTLPAILEAPPA